MTAARLFVAERLLELWIDAAMTLPTYLKPVMGAIVVAALGAGYYWLEHRPRPQETVIPNKAVVVVAKAVNACFSDLVRVTGFVVPRREAIVGVDQEGSKVTDLFVREGDIVTENQELARLTAPPVNPLNPGAQDRGRSRCARRRQAS